MTLPGFSNPLPIDAPLSAKPGILDHALANLLVAFTDCVLVPVPPDVNPEHVHVPMIDEAGTPAFQSKLTVNSVAVVLGPRSQGLLAIKFTDRVGLDAFLDRNPASRQTLITEHADGAVIWHKADAANRPPLDLPGVTIKMVGNVIVFGRADVRRADGFLHRATPTSVNLEDVNWGADPDGHIDVWLARVKWGEFFRKIGRGRMVPCREAWRAYIVRRLKATTTFDSPAAQFYRLMHGPGWQPITEAQLRSELRHLIDAAPVATAQPNGWCPDEWLDRMLRHLRSSLAGELLLVAARLRDFARAAVTLSPRADVTIPELSEEFARYCQKHGLPGLPAKVFQQQITAVLREPPWQRAKSKSVRRATGAQNGFRGVRLRIVPEDFVSEMPRSTTIGVDGVKFSCKK